MELLLHIGTEKTGSSYLQNMAALNRELLRQKGIWFPSGGKREKDMMSGRISPGNASRLSDALQNLDIKSLQLHFEFWIKEAKDQGCNKLLLSNEMLTLTLSNSKAWQNLIHYSKKEGIEKIEYFLIIREPVELTLSLFKHRAKRGTILDIEKWITQNFEYGRVLDKFFENVDQFEPNLICRKYEAGKGYLDRVFFKDWLGIKDSMKLSIGKVNPSLTLSELLIIRSLRKQHKYLPEVAYNRLIKIPKIEKAGENQLENYYRSIITQELTKYKPVWEKCQLLLSKDEQLNLSYQLQEINLINKVASLSITQIDAYNKLLRDSVRLRFQLFLLSLNVRRKLGRLKQRAINIISVKK